MSHVSRRSSLDQGKSASERPMFYNHFAACPCRKPSCGILCAKICGIDRICEQAVDYVIWPPSPETSPHNGVDWIF